MIVTRHPMGHSPRQWSAWSGLPGRPPRARATACCGNSTVAAIPRCCPCTWISAIRRPYCAVQMAGPAPSRRRRRSGGMDKSPTTRLPKPPRREDPLPTLSVAISCWMPGRSLRCPPGSASQRCGRMRRARGSWKPPPTLWRRQAQFSRPSHGWRRTARPGHSPSMPFSPGSTVLNLCLMNPHHHVPALRITPEILARAHRLDTPHRIPIAAGTVLSTNHVEHVPTTPWSQRPSRSAASWHPLLYTSRTPVIHTLIHKRSVWSGGPSPPAQRGDLGKCAVAGRNPLTPTVTCHRHDE